MSATRTIARKRVNSPEDCSDLAVRNPRTGQFDYRMPIYSAAAVAQAVAALRASQPGWAGLDTQQRVEALRHLATNLLAARMQLVAVLAEDTGRWAESEIEFDALIGVIERWCKDAPEMLVAAPPRPSRLLSRIDVAQRMQPYAVAGIISPWNFPLLLSMIDAVPALLAGCSVVIKPSEVTPRFVPVLARLIAASGPLAKVLRFVTGGPGTGAAVIRNADMLCFTGSVATGKRVAVAAAEAFIPCHLELGGKDPAIVCDDADIALAARALTWASMVNAGQSCMSIERCYVDRKVAATFLSALSQEVAALGHCYPDRNSGRIGPIISLAQADIIRRHLNEAYAFGAKALVGGQVVSKGGGQWCEPTLLVDVHAGMAVVREETFAPILPVMLFDSDAEAIACANDSEFGLSACVFSRDRQRAIAIGEQLKAGGVSINEAALTGMVQDAEKQSFGNSGLGGSRMGRASLSRFYRQQALLIGDGKDSPWWFPQVSSRRMQ